MLKMVDPMMFPYARSVAPRAAAPMLTASSGRLVPIATTVSPTTAVEIRASKAIRVAPRTR